MVEQLGGVVVQAELPVHGKTSALIHNKRFCFENFASPLPVGRYHSLVASQVPEGFEVIAHADDLIMSIYHSQLNLLGFQFHPESILTTQGSALLQAAVNQLLSQREALS